jgi:hypothetical protein
VNNYSVFDSVRNHTYKVQADSEAAAIQWVQNDQWSEQLDDANVTPRENLHACELEPNRE